MRGDTRHEGSGPAYFVNCIHDGGGILSREFQSNISVLLVIDECRYLLVIGTLKSEAPPL